jgi:hypothetical protein
LRLQEQKLPDLVKLPVDRVRVPTSGCVGRMT